MYIKLISKKYFRQTIFQKTTLGYLHENHSNVGLSSLLLCTEESNEEVTLNDHNIEEAITEQTQQKLKTLLQEYKDVFSKNTSQMGKTNIMKHEIDVQGSEPLRSKPYRVSQKEREIVDKQINEMLQHNILKPSHSPWASPVVLVKKKTGDIRFCVDYRKLNSVTKKSTYPIPNIDDIPTYLGKAKYFTTLDMFSGQN